MNVQHSVVFYLHYESKPNEKEMRLILLNLCLKIKSKHEEGTNESVKWNWK